MKTNSLYSRVFGVVALLLSWSGAAQAEDALAVDMFRHVVAQEKGNVVFSPASAEAVLLMLRDGAAGQTRRELDALPYGKQGVPSAMQVESANALFAAEDLTLKPLGVKDIRRVPFSAAPAKAADAVNAWCSEKTHGRISSIVSPSAILPDTRLIAINAVYLKEKWVRPFESHNTHPRTFTAADGRELQPPTMVQKASFKYAEGEDWQAVALPYRPQQKGEQGYFIGIRPRGDARAFVEKMDANRLKAIRSALNAANAEPTVVELPRFRIETPIFNLNAALQALGIQTAFTGDADFSGFSKEPLLLSEVRQKCMVQVDEDGTEAAAVTAAIMMRYAMPRPQPEPHIIRFDKPFLWVIADLSTAAPPYFMGLLENP